MPRSGVPASATVALNGTDVAAVTLLSPDRISQRFNYEQSRAVYKDMDEFLADVVRISREMVSQLHAAGCRYVQLDEVAIVPAAPPREGNTRKG